MHILIPCKALDKGKSRLAGCLDAAARHALCKELLARTLHQAARVSDVARIRVVTADEDALDIAARRGIAGLPDRGGGLNAALDSARTLLLADDACRNGILILPIDLPLVTADVIERATAIAGDVVIGPDEHGSGTNLLLLRGTAMRILPFAFGPGSYPAHKAAARARGLTTAIVEDPRIAFDVDGPPQYAAWSSRPNHQYSMPSDRKNG